MAINPLQQMNAAIHASGKDKNAQINAAARQFESVMLTQLLQVMWKSSPEMSQGQGAMYQSMYQSAFADHLAAAGGIGLAKMIAESLGAKPEQPGAGLTRHIESTLGMGLVQPSQLNPVTGQPQVGLAAQLETAADQMLAQGSKQWSKEGTLDTSDLGAIDSGAAGAQAQQTVLRANGFHGYYKCNLFALELARRAGAQVPESADGRTLDFPSSNRLTQDAADGSLATGWAKVATGASPAAMQDALRAGEAAFMLVGQGHGDAHGHVAVIERPRSIDYDEHGQVRSIVFDGWEAQPDGAKHLTERTWNRTGIQGSPGARNGLDRIEIIQLHRREANPHATTKQDGVPPIQPKLGSSSGDLHPTQSAEDRS